VWLLCHLFHATNGVFHAMSGANRVTRHHRRPPFKARLPEESYARSTRENSASKQLAICAGTFFVPELYESTSRTKVQ
jgi:hypothetical protein